MKILRCSNFYFTSKIDEKDIYIYIFECAENVTVKGVVQMSYGMVEYREIYEDFAKILTDNGYNVYVNDHRGHGKTAKN